MRFLIIVTTLCFILKVCVVIQGRYVVEVRLNGYNNPTGSRRSSGQIRCCDTSDTHDCNGDKRCDSYFIYCLRPLGEVSLNPRCFSYEVRTRSSTNVDDAPLNFSQSIVLGLYNPLNLSGWETAYKGVQVYIEIQDDDLHNDDLVDVLLINHNLTVGESLRQNHTGMYNFVTMDLIITVFCDRKFQGSDCTQCVSGFTGSNCDERDYCFGENCSGNGECINNNHWQNPFTCNCNSGYKGDLCEDIDCLENTCSENGRCVDKGDSPNCNCRVGFSGRICEINIDDCLSNPCGEGGRCVDGVDIFQCICNPGFTGEMCQTNIDDCVSVDCTDKGRCVDGVNNFTCECTPGYSGPLCGEVDGFGGNSVSTGSNVGAIAGGIVGVVLTVVILFILIMVVFAVLIVRCRSNKREANNQGIKTFNGNSSCLGLPGDNPVYETGNISAELGGSLPQITACAVVTTYPVRDRDRVESLSVEERKFDNPIYGDGETDDGVYNQTPPPDQKNQESLPNHEFDNPIYGTEAYDS